MIPWSQRTFTFDFPAARFPELLHRIRGTPAKVEQRVTEWPGELLRRRPGEAWSIQEHVGHLLDLDVLHYARLEDYANRAQVLRPADMQNRRTWEAGHNSRNALELAADFRAEREKFVTRLEEFAPSQWERSAVHPRLQQPMRLVDFVFFVAEHDDHHLGKMNAIAEVLGIHT